MKKLLFSLFLVLCSMLHVPCSAYAQTIPPPYINYQAVLYDVNGANPNNPLINQSFTTFVNINDELGNLLYREEHYASTDANGLITVKMGDGLYTAGPITNFNQINWGVGKYYLVVDFDINGTISSTAPEQLVTVPYSFYAGKAGNGMTSVLDNGDGTLTFTYANGATYTTPTLAGIQGPVGPVGPSGPSGAAGTAGQSAYDLWLGQGNTGTVQDFLSTSAYQIWLAQGNTGTSQDFLNTLVGPQGVQGVAGAVGAQGPIGLTGATGATGPQGIQGSQGPTGPQGQNGVGIVSTVMNSNGTITFNYSDGSSYTTLPTSSSNSGNFFSNIGNIETNNSTSAYGRVFALDSNENIYVLGDAQGFLGAEMTMGSISISGSWSGGNYMPFLCKINSDGTLSWLIKLANTGSAQDVRKIATDSSGIYVAFTETVCKYSFSGNLIWSVNNGNSVALILRNNNVLYSLEKVGVAGGYDISIATYSTITGSLLSSTVVLSGTGEQIPIDMAIDNVGNIYYIGTSGTGGSYIRKISSSYSLIWSKSNTNSLNINFPLRSLILSDNIPFSSSSYSNVNSQTSLTFNATSGSCFSFDPTTGTATSFGNHPGKLAYSAISSKIYHSNPVSQTFGTVNYNESHGGIMIGSITEQSDYLMPLSQSNSGTIDDLFISNNNVLYILGSSQYPFVNGLSGQVVTFLPGSTKIFLIKAQL
jgi:hypothetical protein